MSTLLKFQGLRNHPASTFQDCLGHSPEILLANIAQNPTSNDIKEKVVLPKEAKSSTLHLKLKLMVKYQPLYIYTARQSQQYRTYFSIYVHIFSDIFDIYLAKLFVGPQNSHAIEGSGFLPYYVFSIHFSRIHV